MVERRVGPILVGGPLSRAIVAAIEQLNDDVEVEDRSSYVRVRVLGRCVVTRAAIEAHLGASFELPEDLDRVTASHAGRLRVDAKEAAWE